MRQNRFLFLLLFAVVGVLPVAAQWRVGVVQIHPVFEELLHAFDTRPPVQRNEVE